MTADGPAISPAALGPARWVFTGRAGGSSQEPYDRLNLADHVGDDQAAVSRNRETVVRALGAAPGHLAVVAAEHGNNVAVPTSPGVFSGVDALASNRPGLVLMALAADCVPIVLVEPTASVVAVVHSGWRGVVANVAGATVGAMQQLGADPASTTAVLGPSICPRCFEVGLDVQAQIETVAPGSASTTDRGTPSADLPKAITGQLHACGLDRIHAQAPCTFHDPGYFSFRAQGRTGRQGVAVVLAEQD